jgi:hypothetical protein
MTQEQFNKLVNQDLMKMANFQGFGEEKTDDIIEKIWGVSAEEEDWNNDNDNSDIPESDYERDYEFNRANNQ